MDSAKKLIVIHVAGLDWRLLHPMIDAGHLPTTAGLIDRGVIGNLYAQRSGPAPMGALSLATGRPPRGHGVFGPVRADAAATFGMRLADRRDLRAAPFWESVADAGAAAAAVGWPATWPAAPAPALTVSDVFADAAGDNFDGWPEDPLSVSDPGVLSEISELRLHPTEVDTDMVAMFVPDLAGIDQSRDGRPAMLAIELARAATVHAAATWIAEHWRPELLAVHFDLIDRVCGAFLQYGAPRLGHVSERDFDRYRGVVEGAYAFFDMMLARYLELVGPDAHVIVASAHGFHTGVLRPAPKASATIDRQYRLDGALIAAGPDFRQDGLIAGARVIDIAPTVCALLGAPIDPSLRGDPLRGLFANEPPPIHSEAPAAQPPPIPANQDDRRVERKLKELVGFACVPPLPGEAAAANEAMTIAWSRVEATSAIDDGDYDAAIAAADRALALAPQHLGALYEKARALLSRGDHDACIAVVEDLAAAGVAAAETDLLAGLAQFGKGDRDGGRECLLRMLGRRPDGLDGVRQVELAGHALIEQGYPEDAEAAFLQALELDAASVPALSGLGAILTATGRHSEAIERLRASVTERFRQPDVHCNLGRAYAALDRRQEAIAAYRTALEQMPGLLAARDGLEQVMAMIAADAAKHGADRASP